MGTHPEPSLMIISQHEVESDWKWTHKNPLAGCAQKNLHPLGYMSDDARVFRDFFVQHNEKYETTYLLKLKMKKRSSALVLSRAEHNKYNLIYSKHSFLGVLKLAMPIHTLAL